MDDKGRNLKNNNDMEQDEMDLKRGPWTAEEDFKLINYISIHGEGRWNSLSRCAGLQRTGKSCRLRWLNYLRPDVRRGNITLEEQLLIIELHSRWGNRWSKIAQYLPGRTDNEIKNYWRTRVQKHAKQLKCDVNSQQFKDTMKYLWMPRLVERIQSSSASASVSATTTTTTTVGSATSSYITNSNSQFMTYDYNNIGQHFGVTNINNDYIKPKNSNMVVSPMSDLTDFYNAPNPNLEYYSSQVGNNYYPDQNLDSYPQMLQENNFDYSGLFEEYLPSMGEQNNLNWFDENNINGAASSSDSLWNIEESDEDFWFLQQQQFNNNDNL